MFELIIFSILIGLGFFIGRANEKRHYKRLELAEAQLDKIKLIPAKKTIPYTQEVLKSDLVLGSTVISIDFFKMFMASIYNILGGRVKSYESLLDRARREAIIRMKKEAIGFDFIANVRIETSSIGGNTQARQSIGAIEILAYGTAVKLVK